MEITQVKVFPVDEEKLKAYVSIVLDDCFLVSDLKVIQGPNGHFISMPSKRKKNGEFKDVAHPLNNETRRMIEETVGDSTHDIFDGLTVGTGLLSKPRYVPAELATPDGPGGAGLEIEIIGRRRPARLQPEPLFDPQGLRMRQ